jgi:AcrR family transcriptional regulator
VDGAARGFVLGELPPIGAFLDAGFGSFEVDAAGSDGSVILPPRLVHPIDPFDVDRWIVDGGPDRVDGRVDLYARLDLLGHVVVPLFADALAWRGSAENTTDREGAPPVSTDSLDRSAVRFEQSPNGPGRPTEDRFRRREEIFRAIAPRLLECGADVTMRRLARTAYVSVGTLYTYVASKVDLLTFPLQDQSCAENLRRFEIENGHLAQRDPEAYVVAFIDEMVATFPLLRASFAAAVALGAQGFWDAMNEAIGGELEERLAALVRTRGAEFDPTPTARSLKRIYLGAVLDSSVRPQELRRDLVNAAAGQG